MVIFAAPLYVWVRAMTILRISIISIIAALVVTALVTAPVAHAQEGAEAEVAGAELTTDDEAAIEAKVRGGLPDLAPIDDPRRIAQLWDLAWKLTRKHAYCRATSHLEAIEEIQGAITDNQAAAAQAFYMCARVRLFQGFVSAAATKLQRSIAIVGERPEHHDLLFKLAIVRAKKAIDRADPDAIERSLDEATKLGVEMGPGGGDRLADWAVPIIHETATEVAIWSQDLMQAGNRPLADRVSKLALKFRAKDRIANSVRREIVLYTFVLPVVGTVIGVFALAAVFWSIRSRMKIRQAMIDAELDDDI